MNWLKKLFSGEKEVNKEVSPQPQTATPDIFGQDFAEAFKTLMERGTFEAVRTKSPEEATSILFERALPATPNVSIDGVQRSYDALKYSWSSTKLVKGSHKQIKSVILKNLQRIRSEPTFREFEVKVYLEGNAAQVEAIAPPYFIPVRVWRAGNEYYACGNSDFQ